MLSLLIAARKPPPKPKNIALRKDLSDTECPHIFSKIIRRRRLITQGDHPCPELVPLPLSHLNNFTQPPRFTGVGYNELLNAKIYSTCASSPGRTPTRYHRSSTESE